MTEVIATVKQGQVKGVTDIDLNGDKYFKFLGIPYAKPPVGPLRFKAPQPAESWTGVRDASKEGSPCLAPHMITGQTVGSEDCLYLNIYTKELPKSGVNPKPVMVFIHGGAFTMGDGGEEFHGSQFLVAQDVVFVTINYRLGIFGFLSSDDISLEVPGNAGLKDQTFALKWIKENISSFNGDPNNVTIFGVSAGGASIHFQILSPSAKDCFHKAIVQSGSALNPWAWGKKNLIQVAQKLGKNVSSDKEALEVLANASADEVFEASQKFSDVLLDANRRRPFGPVIETPNPTAFLSENPTDLLESGRFNQVPTIYGVCSNEGLLYEFKPEQFAKGLDLKEIGAFWNLEGDNEKLEKVKALVNGAYFKNGDTREAIHEIVGDVNFTIGVIESARLAAKTSGSPVYVYVFDYMTAFAREMLKLFNIEGKFKGVAHGGEQASLFKSNLAQLIPNLDQRLIDETVAPTKMVTKIWADFARSGKPHKDWLPVIDEIEFNYFHITADPKLKKNPFEERMDLWDKVFKEIVSINARIQENSTS